MINENLTCRDLVELVTDYLEGALPPDDLAHLEAHLHGCEACGEYVEQMRLTIKITGKLTEDSIEPQARAELLKVFRRWKAEH